MENNQGIPEEGSADRQALNQMVARMSELTGQDPHEIAYDLTEQMEEALGGEFDIEAVDEFAQQGREPPNMEEVESRLRESDPRSPTYEVGAMSTRETIDEILNGKYSNYILNPQEKPYERKWLDTLDDALATETMWLEGGRINRAWVDEKFFDFMDDHDWIYEDEQMKQEYIDLT